MEEVCLILDWSTTGLTTLDMLSGREALFMEWGEELPGA